jgi:hypothetical protein
MSCALIGVDEDRAAAVDFHHGLFLAVGVEVEVGVAVGGELQRGLAEDALLVGLDVEEQRACARPVASVISAIRSRVPA